MSREAYIRNKVLGLESLTSEEAFIIIYNSKIVFKKDKVVIIKIKERYFMFAIYDYGLVSDYTPSEVLIKTRPIIEEYFVRKDTGVEIE